MHSAYLSNRVHESAHDPIKPFGFLETRSVAAVFEQFELGVWDEVHDVSH
jgi:hypothetical protein